MWLELGSKSDSTIIKCELIAIFSVVARCSRRSLTSCTGVSALLAASTMQYWATQTCYEGQCFHRKQLWYNNYTDAKQQNHYRCYRISTLDGTSTDNGTSFPQSLVNRTVLRKSWRNRCKSWPSLPLWEDPGEGSALDSGSQTVTYCTSIECWLKTKKTSNKVPSGEYVQLKVWILDFRVFLKAL